MHACNHTRRGLGDCVDQQRARLPPHLRLTWLDGHPLSPEALRGAGVAAAGAVILTGRHTHV